MNKQLRRLLRECRKRSGYARHIWEPGMDFDRVANAANFPFKPQGPRADLWGGEIGCWDDILKSARVGITLDVYLTSRGDGGELESNFYIRIISETLAQCQDCCGKPFEVSL